MDLESFKVVVRFTIQTKGTNTFYTPSQDIINAMRTYNTVRVGKAKLNAADLKSSVFIECLRKCHEITQINTAPNEAVCTVSGAKLTNNTGKTLMVHDQKGTSMFCVHHRFVDRVNKFYNIVHFDDEIFKMFREWYTGKFKTLKTINENNIEDVINQFLAYNSSSKINLLYVKFNSICDL
jgi:hypothetical protein